MLNELLMESYNKEDVVLLLELIHYLRMNPSAFIDLNKILRKQSLTQKKLTTLFDILEKEKIGKRVYNFSHPELTIEMIKHFKFYFFDYEYNFITNKPDLRTDQSGALLEQVFYSKICSLNYNVYFFRSQDQIEIDFILTKNNQDFIAVEIKKDQFIYAGDLQGLHYFDKIFSLKKELMVFHNGSRDTLEGKVKIKPMNTGISYLKEITLLQL